MKKPLTSALALIILLVAGAGSAGAGVNDGFLALDDPGKMYELTVETEFAAAHHLRGYQGKCENLHGHNRLLFSC